ncbi:MAG: leucine-rich repeat protein [Clostridia bacterium]|nr:leucine-rich repeat protein [Clostridia bacterium]
MKGTKRQNLAIAIMVAMLVIFSMSAGISFAYFSAIKTSTDQILKFGKLVITVNDGASDVISITSDAEMSDTSVIALSGTIGLEDGSSNAYLRIKPNVTMEYSDDAEVDADAVSEFKSLLLTGLSDADSTGIMQKVGNYVYYAGDFTESTTYNFSGKSINLASYAFNDAWQGASVTISFTIQAIQSSGLGLDLSSYGTNSAKATAISNLSSWGESFVEPIYIDSIATYTLSNDESYYSVKANSTSVSGELNILSEISGVPVTTIEANGFEGCTALTTIRIPSSITTIGANAFKGISVDYTDKRVNIFIDCMEDPGLVASNVFGRYTIAIGGYDTTNNIYIIKGSNIPTTVTWFSSSDVTKTSNAVTGYDKYIEKVIGGEPL